MSETRAGAERDARRGSPRGPALARPSGRGHRRARPARVGRGAVLGIAALSIAACWTGCSGGSASGGSPESDAARLQEILGSDPSNAVLDEIEEAVDSERPVMAAEMIERAGIPAVRRQIERLEGAAVTTQEGRRLRTRAVRVHRARLHALEAYRDALARGIGTEDEDLLDAMRAYAEAEMDIASLADDLARIRPLAAGAGARAADREATLGGLPPLRRGGGEGAVGEEGAPPELPPEGPDPRLGEPQEPLPE